MSRRFGPAETKIMETLYDPEFSRENVPRMDQIQDGAAQLKAMNEEISTIGKFTRKAGFTPGKDFHRVAKIDAAILNSLDKLHRDGCTCGREIWGDKGHKEWFFEWLTQFGSAHDLRPKVIV